MCLQVPELARGVRYLSIPCGRPLSAGPLLMLAQMILYLCQLWFGDAPGSAASCTISSSAEQQQQQQQLLQLMLQQLGTVLAPLSISDYLQHWSTAAMMTDGLQESEEDANGIGTEIRDIYVEIAVTAPEQMAPADAQLWHVMHVQYLLPPLLAAAARLKDRCACGWICAGAACFTMHARPDAQRRCVAAKHRSRAASAAGPAVQGCHARSHNRADSHSRGQPYQLRDRQAERERV